VDSIVYSYHSDCLHDTLVLSCYNYTAFAILNICGGPTPGPPSRAASSFNQCLSSWAGTVDSQLDTFKLLYLTDCPEGYDPSPDVHVGPWCQGEDQQCTPFCADDETFKFYNIEEKTCDWIGELPVYRCDGLVKLACPITCNLPTCIGGCIDDPDYRYNNDTKKSCEWVAKKPSDRCENQESFDACRGTCDPSCKRRCKNNKDYR